MENKVLGYVQSTSLQILGILLILTFLVETLQLNIDYYINIGYVSLFAALLLAYSSIKTKNNSATKILNLTLFYISATLIILSNLYFADYLVGYHPLLYSILLGQMLTLPFIYIEEKAKSSKKKKTSKAKKQSLSITQKLTTKTSIKIITTLILIAILALSFYLRANNADTIFPGRDSFHHYIGAKSIIDSGQTSYDPTLTYINHLLALLFTTFGESFFIARLPIIIAGTLSAILIYLIGRKISNTVGIISAILLAICPWAIGLSRYVRDYSFNVFFELAIITIILYFPKNIKEKKNLLLFSAMNLILYAAVIIFARTQNGLTISIIISILIVTAIRIFFDLELLKEIKTMKLDAKKINLLLSAIILMISATILVLVVFEFYERLGFTIQTKWFFFFLTQSELPMLWYSFMNIPWYFIGALTILPIILKPKNKYAWLSFITFYTYFVFFVYIAKPHTDFLYARYIFPAIPFFTLLMAISIEQAIKTPVKLLNTKTAKTLSVILISVLMLSIFNFTNTLHASNADVNLEDDGRQIISIPYRDYSELLTFLEQQGLTKNDIVICSELRIKDVLGWHFDFDYYQGRTAPSSNGQSYDIADNQYILNETSIDIMIKYETGWIIRRDGDRFPPEISQRGLNRVEPTDQLKYYGRQIEYLGKYSDKYEVYRWYTE